MLVLKEHPSATEPPVPQQNNTLSLALITGLHVCVYIYMWFIKVEGFCSPSYPLWTIHLLPHSPLRFFPTLFFFFFPCPLVTCVVECPTLLNTHKMLSLPVGGKSFLPAMSLTWWPIYKIFLLLLSHTHTKCKNPTCSGFRKYSNLFASCALDCVVNLILNCHSNGASEVLCRDGRTWRKNNHLSSAESIRLGRVARWKSLSVKGLSWHTWSFKQHF